MKIKDGSISFTTIQLVIAVAGFLIGILVTTGSITAYVHRTFETQSAHAENLSVLTLSRDREIDTLVTGIRAEMKAGFDSINARIDRLPRPR